jgi:hypothetical protein
MLNVLEFLAKREPVYGEHFALAIKKLRNALPKEVVTFVDRGRIEFDLTLASDLPASEAKAVSYRRAGIA